MAKSDKFTGQRSVITGECFVQRDGQHFITVKTLTGAKDLASILNQVAAARPLLIADGDAFGREKIAHAVCAALDLKTFRR